MRVVLIDDHFNVVKGVMTPYLRSLALVDLTILADRYKGTPWTLRRPEDALEQLLESDCILVSLSHQRLMCVSLGQPWFSTDWVLSEEWLGDCVTVPEAIGVLTALGKALNVQRFEVGTRATPGQRHEAAARLYQRQGLRLSTCVLEGEINEQESPTQSNGSPETA